MGKEFAMKDLRRIRKLNDFRRLLADSLFPWDKCLLCGRAVAAGGYICEDCGRRLDSYERCSVCCCFLDLSAAEQSEQDSHFCSYCRADRDGYIDEYYSALPYVDECREYLLALKYSDRRQYAGPLGRYLAECLLRGAPSSLPAEKFEKIVGADLVAEVPLHRTRLEERGYNQSALLAEVFGAGLGVPYLPKALQRHKQTVLQHRLSADERRQNTEGAFSAAKNGSKVRGKRVILLDDIITSGSTLNNCAKVLKELGAVEVYGVTVASALLQP